jgi:Arc/MetJ family transcription regulator
LTSLYQTTIIVQMRTTLNIDEALLRKAQRLSGIAQKTAVLHAGLQALVARESAKRLADLGATDRSLKAIPRRRPVRQR